MYYNFLFKYINVLLDRRLLAFLFSLNMSQANLSSSKDSSPASALNISSSKSINYMCNSKNYLIKT